MAVEYRCLTCGTQRWEARACLAEGHHVQDRVTPLAYADVVVTVHDDTCPAPSPTLGPMPLDDQTTRALSLAASKARAWTEKRNQLIRQAFEAGAGVREIAKATGLNVGTVHTMLHGRKR